MKAFINVVRALFILCCLCSFTAEDSTMVQIRNNTHETALHTEKGEIEYISFVVSIFAFVIAGITLFYSIRTYKSQKKTEKNTLRWSPRQERANLRRIAWSLLLSYRKLLALEKMLLETNICPAPLNFYRMIVPIEDLHLNQFFGENIDYDGLYRLSNEISAFNQMLENRNDQAKYSIFVDSHHNHFSDIKRYFVEERTIIYNILLIINDIYPRMFNKDEYEKDSMRRQLMLASDPNILDYQNHAWNLIREGQDQLPCGYQGLFGTDTLEKCNSAFFNKDADRYFSLPYVQYFNIIYNNYRHLNEDRFSNELSQILSKDLIDKNKIGRTKKFVLPLVDNYIAIILSLIEYDSRGFNPQDINDIYSIKGQEDEEADVIKKLVDVYDNNTSTLYTHISIDNYKAIISRKVHWLSFILSNSNYHLFIEHKNGKPIFHKKDIGKQDISVNIYNRNSFPYILNKIEFINLSQITGGYKDTIRLKIIDTKVKALSVYEDQCEWKLTFIIGGITRFSRE